MSDLHAELGQAGPHWAGKERGNSQPEVGEGGEEEGEGEGESTWEWCRPVEKQGEGGGGGGVVATRCNLKARDLRQVSGKVISEKSVAN